MRHKTINLTGVAIHFGLLFSFFNIGCNGPEIPGTRIEHPSNFVTQKMNNGEILRINNNIDEYNGPIVNKVPLLPNEHKVLEEQQKFKVKEELDTKYFEKYKLEDKTLFIYFHGLYENNNSPLVAKLKENLESFGENVIFECATERGDVLNRTIGLQVSSVSEHIRTRLQTSEYKKIYLLGYETGGLVANDLLYEIMADPGSNLEKKFWNINFDGFKGAPTNNVGLITISSPLRGFQANLDEAANLKISIESLVTKILEHPIINAELLNIASSELKELNNLVNRIYDNLIDANLKDRLPGLIIDDSRAGLKDLKADVRRNKPQSYVEALHIATYDDSTKKIMAIIDSILCRHKDFKMGDIYEAEKIIKTTCFREIDDVLKSFAKSLGCEEEVENDSIMSTNCQFYGNLNYHSCRSTKNQVSKVALNHLSVLDNFHIAIKIIEYAKEQEEISKRKKNFSDYRSLFNLKDGYECHIFSDDTTQIPDIESQINGSFIKVGLCFPGDPEIMPGLRSGEPKDICIFHFLSTSIPQDRNSLFIIALRKKIRRVRYFKKDDDGNIELISEYSFNEPIRV